MVDAADNELEYRRKVAVNLYKEKQELLKQGLVRHHSITTTPPVLPIIHTASRSDSGVNGRLSPRPIAVPSLGPAQGALGPSYCTSPFLIRSASDTNNPIILSSTSQTVSNRDRISVDLRINGARRDLPIHAINPNSTDLISCYEKRTSGVLDITSTNEQRSSTPIPVNNVAKRSLSMNSDNSCLLPLENELRRRHQILVAQHRTEALAVRQRFEEGATRTKDPVNIMKVEEQFHHKKDLNSSCNIVGTPNSFLGEIPVLKSNTLPFACQNALKAMSSELNNQDPLFTVRRNLQRAEDDKEQLDQLRQTIESRLHMKLPADLPGALKDGVVLCHLANHIRPRSVTSIHVPSPTVPKLSLAKCRRNVDNFLLACRRIGVDQGLLCTSTAVLDERSVNTLAQTVHALIKCSTLVEPSAV